MSYTDDDRKLVQLRDHIDVYGTLGVWFSIIALQLAILMGIGFWVDSHGMYMFFGSLAAMMIGLNILLGAGPYIITKHRIDRLETKIRQSWDNTAQYA